jgi:hypothetical protein
MTFAIKFRQVFDNIVGNFTAPGGGGGGNLITTPPASQHWFTEIYWNVFEDNLKLYLRLLNGDLTDISNKYYFSEYLCFQIKLGENNTIARQRTTIKVRKPDS